MRVPVLGLILGTRRMSEPRPPSQKFEEAQNRLLAAQSNFFDAVRGVVDENDRLRRARNARKNTT